MRAASSKNSPVQAEAAAAAAAAEASPSSLRRRLLLILRAVELPLRTEAQAKLVALRR